jgi:PhzF family phenazine biosynthesis protein
MKLSLYQLDAFTDALFSGNPAAVIPLESWLSDDLMQKIASENNLAETAFFVPTEDGFHIRWFTPTIEVDLCGHATLATAAVIFTIQNYEQSKIQFESRSGILKVVRKDQILTLDLS